MSLPAPAPLHVVEGLVTAEKVLDALAKTSGFSARPAQRELSAITRDTLISSKVGCVEAPTGTGKTLGYLSGALEAQARSGKELPIVVATATVSLQSQILREDVPRLEAIGALDSRKVAVAKGRGRYFCPRTAEMLQDKAAQDTQLDIFDRTKEVADAGVPIALNMLKAWKDKTWDGERDSWQGPIPQCWESACGASSETCVTKACAYYDSCPYMLSRQRLSTAKLIIANHDIVLADLAQRHDEMNSVLPPKHYALVIDEAHNLPDKAARTKETAIDFGNTDFLLELEPYNERCRTIRAVLLALRKGETFDESVFVHTAAVLRGKLEALSSALMQPDLHPGSSPLGTQEFNDAGLVSWGQETPPAALLEKLLDLLPDAAALDDALSKVAEALMDFAGQAVGADKAYAVRLLGQTHKFRARAGNLRKGLELFLSSDVLVRWASHRNGKLQLRTHPLEGREVLTKLLWDSGLPVMMVSATLQVGGSFERFRSKSGLPETATVKALEPVFDYSRGFLHLPQMETTPGEPGHEAELVAMLTALFEQEVSPGMLVLFTSRESMNRVTRALPDHLRSAVLVQNQQAVPELVAEHKARIDAGHRSILVGLDSMSEGLDLPGDYCGHVVITRLPFAVPGDPVEEARRTSLGKDWFEQAYLADMLTMLIQATGRLIRRESDHGVITVLDKRLTTRRYSMQAYAALPDFTRGPKIRGYFEQAHARGFKLGIPKGKGAMQSAPAKAKLTLVHTSPPKDQHATTRGDDAW